MEAASSGASESLGFTARQGNLITIVATGRRYVIDWDVKKHPSMGSEVLLSYESVSTGPPSDAPAERLTLCPAAV
jgi:hypothetical protein